MTTLPPRSAAPAVPRVGLAFLGCGRVTASHSSVLRRMKRVDRYYASREAERARSFAQLHDGLGWYGAYADALADPRVDVALIATPPHTHLELALQALRAGKHVIVEKPAFLRPDDFDVAQLASRAANRTVFVAENYFYKPLAASLRRLIASGDLGDIRFVHVDATKSQPVRGWRADPLLAGGGALFEGGIHWVALMAHLGLTPVDARGFRANGSGSGERSSAVVFRYAEGAIGTLLHSWEIPSRLRGVRLSHVRGTHGSARFESNGLLVAAGGRRPRVFSPGLRDLLGYRAMFEDVLASIRERRPARYSLALARRDMRLLDAASACWPGADKARDRPLQRTY